MSNSDIGKMSFKQLRDEVQLLRDELAIFKRKYEDAIYNLDSENFGKSFTVEQNNMKAQIKISAEAIKTMVSYNDLEEELEKYSTIEQTAEQIELAVVEVDSAMTNLSVRADQISAKVTNLETFKTSVFTQTEYGFALDGDTTTFTGVIFLTDNDKNKRFAIFHDESQGHEQVLISSSGNANGLPIRIGRAGDVIHFEDADLIVWGDNAPVAVFG